MRLLASFILSLLLSGPVAAENLSGFYLSAAAVLESDFDFAGNANAQDEEGSGNLLAIGYRWSDRLSTGLAYTDANDYENQQFGTSQVNMWEIGALFHGAYAGKFDPYFRLSAYRAEFREDWTEGIRGNTSEGLLWGLGLDYRLTPGGVVRLEYAPGSLDGDDLDRLMLGAVLQFSD
jgi:opacity protein-like surface antigen